MRTSNNYEKLDRLAKILEIELSAPNFRKCTEKSKETDKARYLYIWISFNFLNMPRVAIRDTMPCYQYGKTIYQVLRRMYLRRKDQDLNYEINQIKKKLGGIQ